MFLKEAYLYKLIPDSLTEQQARHILGTQANLWTESITDWGKLTYMIYPRVFAVAENAWTSESQQDWDGFTRRLDQYLHRLDFQGTRYATSAYNVNIQHRGVKDGIEFTFDTEINGLEYFYTLDGSEPDTSSYHYQGPFIATEGITISARAFREAMPVGKISSLSFPVHKGAGGQVKYITPYLDFKDAAGDSALVDYNYASLSIGDDNWQGFGGNMEVILEFEEPKTVEEVQLTNLRFTISGVYIPENYRVYGSTDGLNYFRLGEIDLSKASLTQGRNKVTSNISFPAQELRSLRVTAKSLNPIPVGHHRAGESSRIYLDEIVVL
jgi:hexosaminidase